MSRLCIFIRETEIDNPVPFLNQILKCIAHCRLFNLTDIEVKLIPPHLCLKSHCAKF